MPVTVLVLRTHTDNLIACIEACCLGVKYIELRKNEFAEFSQGVHFLKVLGCYLSTVQIRVCMCTCVLLNIYI